MHTRRVSTITALALVAALMSGCAGDPSPTETTSLFATEDEAFAAAEETYRAYVDAANRRFESDGAEPDPTEFLSGLALEDELDTNRRLAESARRITGKFQVERVSFRRFDPASKSLVMGACLDISGTAIVNTGDEDVTPPDRIPVISLEVVVEGNGTAPSISEINSDPTGEPC